MQPTVIGAEPKSLYWIRGRVERSQYERPPKLLAIRTNTVAARAGRDRRAMKCSAAATAGAIRSFGSPNAPVLRDSLRLEVDEGDGVRVLDARG